MLSQKLTRTQHNWSGQLRNDQTQPKVRLDGADIYVRVSGGKKCLYFREFGVLRFLVRPFWHSPFTTKDLLRG